MQKELTDEDRKYLDLLNTNVEVALSLRKAWLDSKMSEYAEMQLGDHIYDLESGRDVGVVTKLYRMNENNPLYDSSLDVEYRFKVHGSVNFHDNTSRQPFKYGAASCIRKRK